MNEPTYTTYTDIRDMVVQVLEASQVAAEFDVDAITGELMAAADHDGREYANLPDGDDFWAIVQRHDIAGDRDDDAETHLAEAEEQHGDLATLEAHVSATRGARDAAVRAAISAGASMYAIAKRLGVPEQTIRRIRDRG